MSEGRFAFFRWLQDVQDLNTVAEQSLEGASQFSAATAYLSPEGAAWLTWVTRSVRGPRRLIAGVTPQLVATLPGIWSHVDGQVGLRLYWPETGLFHPKVMLWLSAGQWHAVVGSTNLTGAGLYANTEANLYIVAPEDDPEMRRMASWMESLWDQSLAISPGALPKLQMLAGVLQPTGGHSEEQDTVLGRVRELLHPRWPLARAVEDSLDNHIDDGDLNAEYIREFLEEHAAEDLLSEWNERFEGWYRWFHERREHVRDLIRDRREMVESRMYVVDTTKTHRQRLIQLDERGYLAVAISTIFRHRDPQRVDELLSRVREKAPGIGMATVTEILHMCWPDQYAIYNKRSGVGLGLVLDHPQLFVSGGNTIQDYSLFMAYARRTLVALFQAIRETYDDHPDDAELDRWMGVCPWLVLDHFLEWIYTTY